MELTTDGPVVTVNFGRPQKANALDGVAWTGLREALAQAGADTSTRAVILEGSPSAFCAGNDISVMAQLSSPATARDYFLGLVLPAVEAIVTCPVPVICAIRGVAFGAGAEVTLLSDLAVAGDRARFRLPEVGIGVWPTVFAAAVPYTVGHKAGSALTLTTSEHDAESALRLGLVHEVVPDADVDARARAIASDIAAAAPDAVRRTKRYTTARLRGEGLVSVRQALTELAEHTIGSAEATEGINSFLEKRRPTFADVDASRSGIETGEVRG